MNTETDPQPLPLAEFVETIETILSRGEFTISLDDADRMRDELRALLTLRANLRKLLNLVGRPAKCSECDREIWFLPMRMSGKVAPYTDEALSHFADCPAAQRFRRP